MKLNMKINKIKELYKSKEKNLSEMMSWTIITKFFDMIRHATRYDCANVTKTANECFEYQITRLKKIIKKLKKNDRKNERYDWRKYLNENNSQTINDYDFNVSFARD